MLKKLIAKYFRTDNWSLTAAKIVGILWIPASFVVASLIIKPHDLVTWVNTVLLMLGFVIFGGVLGYIAVINNWQTH